MIEIIVDCNNDSIRIKGRGIDKETKLNSPYKLAELLDDLFNTITDGHDSIGVTLYRIDEDHNQMLGDY